MQRAVTASLALHFGLIAAAWFALNQAPSDDLVSLESIAVSLVPLHEFSSAATSDAVSAATENLRSAGAEPVEPVESELLEPTETVPADPVATTSVDPLDPLEPVEVADPPSPVSPEQATAAPERIEPVATENAPAMLAEPVEALEMAEAAILAAAPLSVPPAETVAAIEPVGPEPAETAEEVPAAPPPRSPGPPLGPVETADAAPLPKVRTVAQRQEPTYPEARPRKPAAAKPQPAGNGGRSTADSRASAPSGAQGRGDAAGNAEVTRYPGQVQAKIRRALRFPDGAGRASGEVQVQFVVSASGGVSEIAIIRSSGHAALDKAAAAAVKRAAPFPPIPAAAGRTSWRFVVPLAFQRQR